MGLNVIGINFAEGPVTAQEFADAFGITFPVLVDLNGSVYNAYQPAAGACTSPFPLDFIIDAQGRVRFWRCEYDPVAMIDVIEELLGGSINVAESEPAPATTLRLEPNRPNPFNPFTRFAYHLPTADVIRVAIHDPRGRLVRMLIHGRQPAGRHELLWDGRDTEGRDVASGMYLYSITDSQGRLARKLTLVR